ncbi:GIY-YIG nuclease family protein [Phenylobacterium sp.]|uniref:GIY-YIG nuclease family protein n=1 Tax=Phenylobacterium sp. TaxID=1871053 RepID=UPI0039494222
MSRAHVWPSAPDGRPLSREEHRKAIKRQADDLLKRPRPHATISQARRQRRKDRASAKEVLRDLEPPVLVAPEGHCCVYVIGCRRDPVKVGFAADVTKRLHALQTGSPKRLRVFGTVIVRAEAARKVELACHNRLAHRRRTGEWFEIDAEDALFVLRGIAQDWRAAGYA